MMASFNKRLFFYLLIGILGMGTFLSFLVGVSYGTDTSTFMNTAIAVRLGLSFGTTMVITNGFLFLFQLIWGRHLIGFGTICNMTLIGYTCDFCRYLESRLIPAEAFTTQPARTILFIAALVPFLFFTTMYMISDQGLAPYDAPAVMISSHFHLPFSAVRMAWDGTAVLIGILAGGHLSVGTIAFLFAVGPTVSAIGVWMRRALHIPEKVSESRG